MSLTTDQERYIRNCIGGDFGTAPPNDYVDNFAISATQNTVTLSHSPGTGSPPSVFKNNILLEYTRDYAISGTLVTFVSNLINGDSVIVQYTT